ncbi:MAG: hypothetical protein JO288_21255 [Hyphomicrobiales bacterium]|nr:hypothetical protein [Hyphomicrobiales bacterium]
MKLAYVWSRTRPWLAAAAAASIMLAVSALWALAESALDRMRQRDLAEMALAHASQAVVTTSYAVLSLLESDDDAETGRAAPLVFLDAVRAAKDELDEALRLAPDKSVVIAMFKERFGRLAESAQAAFLAGNAAPRLTRARELTPAELAGLASRANMAAKTDLQLQALARDVRALEDDLAGEAARLVAQSRVQSRAAIAALVAAILAALAAFRAAGRRDALAQWRARRELRAAEEVRDLSAGPGPARVWQGPSPLSRAERPGRDDRPLLAAPANASAEA